MDTAHVGIIFWSLLCRVDMVSPILIAGSPCISGGVDTSHSTEDLRTDLERWHFSVVILNSELGGRDREGAAYDS